MKYKIGKYVVDAKSPIKAHQAVKLIKQHSKQKIKDRLTNSELNIFAHKIEKTTNEDELKNVVYEIINYDKSLFNKLKNTFDKQYFDFAHKRNAVKNTLILEMQHSDDSIIKDVYDIKEGAIFKQLEPLDDGSTRYLKIMKIANDKITFNIIYKDKRSGQYHYDYSLRSPIKFFKQDILAGMYKQVNSLYDSKVKDYMPPYAVWVKENGKWKIYSGSNSANVDRNAFLAKGYEDVKVVKNGDDVKDSKVKDEAFDRQTIEALISDEQAAIDAYNVAIANLDGKISEESIKVLQNIRDDEQNHVANLNAILSNNVTEKNLEDSIKDADPKQTVATIVAMLDDAKSAIQSEQYQRCSNLCFNIIQKLKVTGLAK